MGCEDWRTKALVATGVTMVARQNPRELSQSLFHRSGQSKSVASAAAAAHAATAGGHFAREINVVRLCLPDWIAVAAHGVIRKRFSLPGFDIFATRQRQYEKGQSGEAEQAYGPGLHAALLV
jgi:hypothetical protein